MLLLSDPIVGAIPIEDCEEGLIDLTDVPELALDLRASSNDFNMLNVDYLPARRC